MTRRPAPGASISSPRATRTGAALVGLILAFALAGPALSSHDALTSDFVRGARGDSGPVGPSAEFLLGADRLFRDELVRLACGARLSLLIATLATALATVLGAAVGVVAGYYEGRTGPRLPWASLATAAGAGWLWISGRGRAAAVALVAAVVLLAASRRVRALRAGPALSVDAGLMRLVDVGLAFPFLLLVMAIGAAFEETTATTLILTLGLTGWLGMARVVRAKTLTIKNLDFVLAARALGESTPRVLWKHVVPNVAGTIVVLATLSIAQMIVAESVLSYLGAGVSPPTPTWGQMLYEGQEFYTVAPWLLVAPAALIVMAVFGFNLLGEGLRDALDPRLD